MADVRTGVYAVADTTTLTIATGVVTVTQGFHTIAAETGTTDDLDTINLSNSLSSDLGTYRPMLFLIADSGDTITVKHGTGNIVLNAAGDYSLTAAKMIILFHDGTNWHDLGA